MFVCVPHISSRAMFTCGMCVCVCVCVGGRGKGSDMRLSVLGSHTFDRKQRWFLGLFSQQQQPQVMCGDMGSKS